MTVTVSVQQKLQPGAYSISNLFQRLADAGFDTRFVRQYILPDWWEDSMAANPANRTMAEVSIARMIGVSVKDLRSPETALTPAVNLEFRLKHNRQTRVEKMRPALALAQSLATTLAACLTHLPPVASTPYSAQQIRKEVLRDASSVALSGLLGWCWAHGIIVVCLCRLPNATKKFSGMAFFCDQRPVVVLASGHDSPPWLAYHLAHELGHIMLGHVEPNKPVFDENLDQAAKFNDPTDSVAYDEEEASANEFAMRVLTSLPSLEYGPLYGLTADKLAKKAQEIERDRQINSGSAALIYGRTANRMAVAQNALKLLQLDRGGHQLIIDAVKRHLPNELPETLQAFLALIDCES